MKDCHKIFIKNFYKVCSILGYTDTLKDLKRQKPGGVFRTLFTGHHGHLFPGRDSIVTGIGYFSKWVIPEKIHPPRQMGSFFNPPSHLDFLKHKTTPPVWISKIKDPPLPPGFLGKIIRFKFHLFLLENTHNHI